jgi:hypothetical protein
MTPQDILAKVGRALHGEHFAQSLAKDLDINRDTPRRWLAGKTPLQANHGVFGDLLALLNRRIAELTKVRDELARWMKAQK